MMREKEQLKGAGLKSASELNYITPEGRLYQNTTWAYQVNQRGYQQNHRGHQ